MTFSTENKIETIYHVTLKLWIVGNPVGLLSILCQQQNEDRQQCCLQQLYHAV